VNIHSKLGEIAHERAVPKAAGGWHAIRYAFSLAFKVGPFRMAKAMLSRNACKTCALGMGGQSGGMRNELGHFPEVCKKSLQAMAADLQSEVASKFFKDQDLEALRRLSPRDLETAGRLTAPLYLGPGDTHFKTLTWEGALGLAAGALAKADPTSAFFYFSGRSSNESAFLLATMARLYRLWLSCLRTFIMKKCFLTSRKSGHVRVG